MAYETPESALFTFAHPTSSLPTHGWVRIYHWDVHTSTINIREVQVETMSAAKSYDKIQFKSFPGGASHDFGSRGPVSFYFDFPDAIRKSFAALVDVCRVPSAAEASSVEQINSSVQALTGISMLSIALVRELLLGIALAVTVLPLRNTQQQAGTIYAIASAGPPSDEYLTGSCRKFISQSGYLGNTLHPRAEAALIEGRWRQPQYGSAGALWSVTDQALEEDKSLEESSKHLFRVLVDIGYLKTSPEPNGEMLHLLDRLAQQGSVKLLRFITQQYLSMENMRAKCGTAMLLRAVGAAGEPDRPDRRQMITFLLDDAAIDPNGEGPHWSGAPAGKAEIRQTALHIASESGNSEILKILVRRGARHDIQDEERRLPSERVKR